MAVDFQPAFVHAGGAGDLNLAAIIKCVAGAGQFQAEPPFQLAYGHRAVDARAPPQEKPCGKTARLLGRDRAGAPATARDRFNKAPFQIGLLECKRLTPLSIMGDQSVIGGEIRAIGTGFSGGRRTGQQTCQTQGHVQSVHFLNHAPVPGHHRYRALRPRSCRSGICQILLLSRLP